MKQANNPNPLGKTIRKKNYEIHEPSPSQNVDVRAT